MQVLVRTPMYKQIYNDHNTNTQQHFLKLMFAMGDKVLNFDNTIKTFLPELQALKQRYNDMLDFENQQDAFEMCDYLLHKLHSCIRIPCRLMDDNPWKTNDETITEFVDRRIQKFHHAQENSTVYDHCGVPIITIDICQNCVNCHNECGCNKSITMLSRDKNLIMAMTNKKKWIYYAFLTIDGMEESKYVSKVHVENNGIITNNDWKELTDCTTTFT